MHELAHTAADDWADDERAMRDAETRRSCFQGALRNGHTHTMRSACTFWVALASEAGQVPETIIASFGAKRPEQVSSDPLVDIIRAQQFELVPDLIRLGGRLQTQSLKAVHDASQPFASLLQHQQYEAALMLLAPMWLEAPAVALYASVCLGKAVRASAATISVSSPSESARLGTLADGIAATQVALLETLSEPRRFELLRRAEGEAALQLAAEAEWNVLFHQPWVHKFFVSRWRGELLDAVQCGHGVSEWGGPVKLTGARQAELALVTALIVLPVNLFVCLPLMTLYPPVKRHLLRILDGVGDEGEHVGQLQPTGYCRRYRVWWSSFLLLITPKVKFLLYHGLNLAFVAVLVVLDSSEHAASLLVWSASLVLAACWRIIRNEGSVAALDIGFSLLGSALVTAACILALQPQASPGLDEPRAVSELIMIAVLVLCVNTAVSTLGQSRTAGPLVLIMKLMLWDMALWVCLSVVVTLCTFAALCISSYDQPVSELLWELNLLSLQLGSDGVIPADEQTTAETASLLIFRILTGSLLGPLFGAIVFERYSAIYPDRENYFRSEFARVVLRNVHRSTVPPPIRIISLPAALARWTLRRAALKQQAGRNHADPEDSLLSSDAPAPLSTPAEPVARLPESHFHSHAYRRDWPRHKLIKLIEGSAWRSAEPPSLALPRSHSSVAPEAGAEPPATPAPRQILPVYDGFEERVSRIVFPYGAYLTGQGQAQRGTNRSLLRRLSRRPARQDAALKHGPVLHMTILANGVVENEPKELKLVDKDDDLTTRALTIFPMRQTMAEDAAKDHINRSPNNHFVWRRDDGSYAVCHCWPVRYDAKWKATFESVVGTNPDKEVFSPLVAAELRATMTRLFGSGASEVPLVYSRKTQANRMPAMVRQPQCDEPVKPASPTLVSLPSTGLACCATGVLSVRPLLMGNDCRPRIVGRWEPRQN